MRLEDYEHQRNSTYHKEKYRNLCVTCLRPQLTCYCSFIQSFDPKIRFVILIHGREAQKRIATGRLSHLCLENSQLLGGYDDYGQDIRVNAILSNPHYHCVVLYPGANSQNLSKQDLQQRSELFPKNKELVVFVIDGTWITARKTLQRSSNLCHLPQISFETTQASRFRIRQQPKANCYSTVEAIHQSIELLGPLYGFSTASRVHDGLLFVFDKMVEQQIALSRQPKLKCQWTPKRSL